MILKKIITFILLILGITSCNKNSNKIELSSNDIYAGNVVLTLLDQELSKIGVEKYVVTNLYDSQYVLPKHESMVKYFDNFALNITWELDKLGGYKLNARDCNKYAAKACADIIDYIPENFPEASIFIGIVSVVVTKDGEQIHHAMALWLDDKGFFMCETQAKKRSKIYKLEKCQSSKTIYRITPLWTI